MSTVTQTDKPTPTSSKLEQELAWLASRRAEDADATRRRLFALTPDPKPIPEGETLSKMVEGQWPRDETDEQIRDALERLS